MVIVKQYNNCIAFINTISIIANNTCNIRGERAGGEIWRNMVGRRFPDELLRFLGKWRDLREIFLKKTFLGRYFARNFEYGWKRRNFFTIRILRLNGEGK